MPELAQFIKHALWIAGLSWAAMLLFLWLFIIGGTKYDVAKTEEHSEDFASIVSEGHGPTTIFLWLSYILILAWTVYYFWVNGEQFWIIFASHP